MRIAKTDIPVRLDVPGATARQLPDFGNPGGTLGAEYFSLAAGTDLAPLFVGLPGDSCQAEHWGYVLTGHAVVSYTDGSTEHCRTGDVFYWPAGHAVRFEQDTDLIMFSPQAEHAAVLTHVHGMLTSS
jgi:hypothetical protein